MPAPNLPLQENDILLWFETRGNAHVAADRALVLLAEFQRTMRNPELFGPDGSIELIQVGRGSFMAWLRLHEDDAKTIKTHADAAGSVLKTAGMAGALALTLYAFATNNAVAYGKALLDFMQANAIENHEVVTSDTRQSLTPDDIRSVIEGREEHPPLHDTGLSEEQVAEQERKVEAETAPQEGRAQIDPLNLPNRQDDPNRVLILPDIRPGTEDHYVGETLFLMAKRRGRSGAEMHFNRLTINPGNHSLWTKLPNEYNPVPIDGNFRGIWATMRLGGDEEPAFYLEIQTVEIVPAAPIPQGIRLEVLPPEIQGARGPQYMNFDGTFSKPREGDGTQELLIEFDDNKFIPVRLRHGHPWPPNLHGIGAQVSGRLRHSVGTDRQGFWLDVIEWHRKRTESDDYIVVSGRFLPKSFRRITSRFDPGTKVYSHAAAFRTDDGPVLFVCLDEAEFRDNGFDKGQAVTIRLHSTDRSQDWISETEGNYLFLEKLGSANTP